MYNLIRFTRMQAHNYKTEKAYIILSQAKIPSNLFDACSQQLLSLYHSLPNLKYPSFVGYIQNGQQDVDSTRLIRTHPRYTYDSLLNTFKALQLLTQTISNISHDSLHFVPITHNNTIQHRVKKYITVLKIRIYLAN